MVRREFRDLADPEAARAAIEDLDVAAGTESVPLAEARGRALAERVDAGIDVPGFDRAAMDGYAVRAADTVGASETDPVALAVIGSVHAGEAPDAGLTGEGPPEVAGEAVQVATGAVVPDGADAVVPVERTVERESVVEVNTAVTPGDSVAPRGADIAAGDRALGPGTRLGPRHLGVLAALGRESVPVRGRPRVGVLSTGAELVQPGEPLDNAAGRIYDVNTVTVASAVEAAGGDPARFVADSDGPEDIRAALAAAADASELVLTSGSTSAGTADVLHRLVEDEGEVLVHGVALKPGRPMLVGHVFGTPYVGLPGYPVSALTVFRTFVAPRIRAAAGQPVPADASVEARLATRVRYDGGRLRFVPVGLVGDGSGSLVAYAPAKGSGATTSLVETDGVVRMAPETALLPRNETVTVERFDADDPLAALLAVGDPDPVLFALLDGLGTSRFLSLAGPDARRWLQDDIPDVVVTAGDLGAESVAGEPLASWSREWGLVVSPDNPAGVDGVEDLADMRFANLAEESSLRAAFDAYLADRDREADAFGRDLPGLESAARSVREGRADAALGLHATAADLGLGFVSLGTQRLALVPNAGRAGKEGLAALEGRLGASLAGLLADRPGYEA